MLFRSALSDPSASQQCCHSKHNQKKDQFPFRPCPVMCYQDLMQIHTYPLFPERSFLQILCKIRKTVIGMLHIKHKIRRGRCQIRNHNCMTTCRICTFYSVGRIFKRQTVLWHDSHFLGCITVHIRKWFSSFNCLRRKNRFKKIPQSDTCQMRLRPLLW